MAEWKALCIERGSNRFIKDVLYTPSINFRIEAFHHDSRTCFQVSTRLSLGELFWVQDYNATMYDEYIYGRRKILPSYYDVMDVDQIAFKKASYIKDMLVDGGICLLDSLPDLEVLAKSPWLKINDEKWTKSINGISVDLNLTTTKYEHTTVCFYHWSPTTQIPSLGINERAVFVSHDGSYSSTSKPENVRANVVAGLKKAKKIVDDELLSSHWKIVASLASLKQTSKCSPSYTHFDTGIHINHARF